MKTDPCSREARASNPIRSILCPVDFSEPSRGALRAAWGLARSLHARFFVLHVVDDRFAQPLTPLSVFERIRQDVRSEAEARLGAFVEAALPTWPMPERFVRWGAPADEIVSEIGRSAPDLVVLGTHGRSGLERFAVGSVAEKVVRASPVPVLTVRGGGSWTLVNGSRGGAERKILLATDLSEHAARAASLAAWFAATFDAELSVLHVVVPAPDLSDPIGVPLPIDFTGKRENDARARLDEWSSRFLPTDTRRRNDVVVASSAVEGIVREAAAQRVDLVVLGTHGWGLFHRALLGSVAARTLRRAPCPVLTLRPTDATFQARSAKAAERLGPVGVLRN
jgi:nucleotide-binding universal stress UspA family protein